MTQISVCSVLISEVERVKQDTNMAAVPLLVILEDKKDAVVGKEFNFSDFIRR